MAEKVSPTKIARRYKHAAGKSNTYSPEVVDMIYQMAREGVMAEPQAAEFVGEKLAAERDAGKPVPGVGFDQLVVLSANLTRLVIDPYREQCGTAMVLGGNAASKPLPLASPLVLGGLDFSRLPDAITRVFLTAAARLDVAVRLPAGMLSAAGQIEQVPKLIAVLEVDEPAADLALASAVELTAKKAEVLTQQVVCETAGIVGKSGIPVGVMVPACAASPLVDELFEAPIDYLAADGQWTESPRPGCVFPELLAAPALGVIADCVDRLRAHFCEERIQVAYFGGIRGGADAAKAICLGAAPLCVGLGGVLAMGYGIRPKTLNEPGILQAVQTDLDEQDAVLRLVNYLKSIIAEVTMLTRAAGKTNVPNLEPEDLRALTIETSAATGVPLCGKDWNFRTGHS